MVSFPADLGGGREKYKGTVSFRASSTSSTTRQTSGNPNLSFGQANTTTTITTPSADSRGNSGVTLYLPQAINIADQMGYENVDLGMIGLSAGSAARSAMAQSGASTGTAIKNIINDVTSSLSDNYTALKQSGAAGVAALLADAFAPDNIRAGVTSATGFTANPHKRSIFRDVGLRSFNFSFTMMPASQADAQSSEDIVKFFREHLYPERLGDLLYKFPDKFTIEFKYDGKEVASKILPCYLTSVNTIYNPQSTSFHDDGKFTSIQIDLQFQEEATLDKKLVEEGY